MPLRGPHFSGISTTLSISTLSAKMVDMSRRANLAGVPQRGLVDIWLAFRRCLADIESTLGRHLADISTTLSRHFAYVQVKVACWSARSARWGRRSPRRSRAPRSSHGGAPYVDNRHAQIDNPISDTSISFARTERGGPATDSSCASRTRRPTLASFR